MEGKVKGYFFFSEIRKEELKVNVENYKVDYKEFKKFEVEKSVFYIFNYIFSWEVFEEMMYILEIMLGFVGEGEVENSGSLKCFMIWCFLCIINVYNDKWFFNVLEMEIMFECMWYIFVLYGLLLWYGYGWFWIEDWDIDWD